MNAHRRTGHGRAAELDQPVAAHTCGGEAGSDVNHLPSFEHMFEFVKARVSARQHHEAGACAPYDRAMALDLPCPDCGTQMYAEQAHNRCPACLYYEPCCDGAPQPCRVPPVPEPAGRSGSISGSVSPVSH